VSETPRRRRLAGEFAHRDALIGAAVAEFAAQGYELASVNRILAASGMSKGQFYHHFVSKEALYLALVEHMLARKREHFASLPPPDPSLGMFELLRVQLRAGMAFTRAHPDLEAFARSFMRERGTPIFALAIERYGFAGHEGLAQLLALGRARGELDDTLSPAFMTRALAHLFNGVLELIDARDLEGFERGLDEFITLLRRAFGKSR
jgi:AcrR family transcriptional regulator